jgi:hypothetical protein
MFDPVTEQMLGLITGCWVSQIVGTLAELNSSKLTRPCESMAPLGYYERTSELDECSNLCWYVPAAWDYGIDRLARV